MPLRYRGVEVRCSNNVDIIKIWMNYCHLLLFVWVLSPSSRAADVCCSAVFSTSAHVYVGKVTNDPILHADSGYDGTAIQWKDNFESSFSEICEIGRYRRSEWSSFSSERHFLHVLQPVFYSLCVTRGRFSVVRKCLNRSTKKEVGLLEVMELIFIFTVQLFQSCYVRLIYFKVTVTLNLKNHFIGTYSFKSYSNYTLI